MNEGSIRLFLCGDVMTGRGVDQVLPHPSDPELREAYVRSARTYVELAERANGPVPRQADPAYIWGAALAEWRRAAPDVRLINLETAITRSRDFAPKGINYRMAPENAACLAAAGIDACSLANNHVLDFGPRGLAETLETLRRLGVRTAGAGRSLAEAGAPAIIPIPGKAARVILAAAALEDSGVPPAWRAGARAPGVNLVEPSERSARALADRIAGVRRPGDMAVASIHWGSNWGYQTPEAHRRFAHALIDTGQVSIVHGHSSHHPRPIEIYRDRLILYGCGDFLNDYEGIRGYEEFRSGLVAMYFADVAPRDGALLDLVLTPLTIRRLRLNRAAPEETDWLRETLTRESRIFGVTFDPTGSGSLRARRVGAAPA
jgi:poly-gamma-glutamate capsule biosynthesis protein CapA/YwtB (metallophosphatase superfamily)